MSLFSSLTFISIILTSLLIASVQATAPTEECKYFDLSKPLTLNFSPNSTMHFPLGGMIASDMYHQSQRLHEDLTLNRSISVTKIDSPNEKTGRFEVTESLLQAHLNDPSAFLSPVVLIIYLTNGHVDYFNLPRVRHVKEYSCYVPYDGSKTVSHIDIKASREPKMNECGIDVTYPPTTAKWSNEASLVLKEPKLAHVGTQREELVKAGSVSLPDRELKLYYSLYEHPAQHAVLYIYETNLHHKQGKEMTNAEVSITWDNQKDFRLPLPAWKGVQYNCYYIFGYHHLQIDKVTMSHVL